MSVTQRLKILNTSMLYVTGGNYTTSHYNSNKKTKCCRVRSENDMRTKLVFSVLSLCPWRNGQ